MAGNLARTKCPSRRASGLYSYPTSCLSPDRDLTHTKATTDASQQLKKISAKSTPSSKRTTARPNNGSARNQDIHDSTIGTKYETENVFSDDHGGTEPAVLSRPSPGADSTFGHQPDIYHSRRHAQVLPQHGPGGRRRRRIQMA